MHGCSTNEVKKGEIGKMFLKRRFDVCALSETKGGDTLHSERLIALTVTSSISG